MKWQSMNGTPAQGSSAGAGWAEATGANKSAALAANVVTSCGPTRFILVAPVNSYLIVAAKSPDIAASCDLQAPQSCCPPGGKSKCALPPPAAR